MSTSLHQNRPLAVMKLCRTRAHLNRPSQNCHGLSTPVELLSNAVSALPTALLPAPHTNHLHSHNGQQGTFSDSTRFPGDTGQAQRNRQWNTISHGLAVGSCYCFPCTEHVSHGRRQLHYWCRDTRHYDLLPSNRWPCLVWFGLHAPPHCTPAYSWILFQDIQRSLCLHSFHRCLWGRFYSLRSCTDFDFVYHRASDCRMRSCWYSTRHSQYCWVLSA